MPTPNRGLTTPDLTPGENDWGDNVAGDIEDLDIEFQYPLVEDVDHKVYVNVGTLLLFGTGSATLSTGATEEFLSPVGLNAPDATEANRHFVVNKDCRAKNLYARLGTAPGSGKSRTITLRKAGADSALAVTIADAATTGEDASDSIDLAKGDLIAIECVATGTPAASTLQGGIELEQYGAA